MNPEYYVIYPDDITSGPYSTAEEARRNVDAYQLKRNPGGVVIARSIAVSSTKATFSVSWNKPYELGDGTSDAIVAEHVLP